MSEIDNHLVQIWERNKFIGNGFIVKCGSGNRKLVTAGHVAYFNDKWTEYEIRHKGARVEIPGKPTFVVNSSIFDYAEMGLGDGPGLPLARSVVRGEILRVVGSHGQKGSYEVEVKINNKKDVDLTAAEFGYLVYKETGPKSQLVPGTSGSAVINSRGEVVCVNVGGYEHGTRVGVSVKR